ncbi:SDR family oxidoreductase [Mycobacterium sp. 663a-19]|uniref:NAD-dependent epimerase/dehydratase family protein n=1 Tax=Mycobacterium sp. 663a-19 TaxID=2986148 RepID=UPI002D1F2FF1|nr:SDR family oxidoreductase [Mycobacterium sp. 663a-19]MEB3983910.1 SDR family oxidoreductase [Mycobacterium sp. 663a-19]
MQVKRILVIGGSGYVGPEVIRRLKYSSPDVSVHGIDAGWFADQCDGAGPLPELLYDSFSFTDVRDLTAEDVEGYESVVYLAAISNDPMGDRFASLTRQVNHREAVRVASLARAQGAKGFVLASSASVYGRGDGDRTEVSYLDPQTEYARSKVAAESDLQALTTQNFRVTSLRFATACGWSPRVRLDLVLNDFVASAMTVGRIVVLSDGSPWRPLIHVKDMALAVEWAVSQERQSFPPYLVVNVGRADWNFRMKDLADAVASILGGVSVSVNSNAAPDTRSYRVDFSTWQQVAPNHQPRVCIEEAIQELAANLARVSGLSPEFRTSSRIRLRRLQQLMTAGFLDDELRWRKR